MDVLFEHKDELKSIWGIRFNPELDIPDPGKSWLLRTIPEQKLYE